MSKRVERFYMNGGTNYGKPYHGLYGPDFGYKPEKPKVLTQKEADEWPEGWVDVEYKEPEKKTEDAPFSWGVFAIMAIVLIGVAIGG